MRGGVAIGYRDDGSLDRCADVVGRSREHLLEDSGSHLLWLPLCGFSFGVLVVVNPLIQRIVVFVRNDFERPVIEPFLEVGIVEFSSEHPLHVDEALVVKSHA